MFIADNQFIFQLLVNDSSGQVDFPIDASLLAEAHIIQNNLLKVPVAELIFYDTLGIQEAQAVFGDAAPFSIALGPASDRDAIRYHPFRVFNIPEQRDTQKGSRIKIVGYLDIPKYFRKRINQPYLGFTSEVITLLAEDAGITIEATQTSDRQIWLPDGRVNADFARYLCNRGWVNNISCMELAITQTPYDTLPQNTFNIPWTIRYVDITSEMKKLPKTNFFNRSEGPTFSPQSYDYFSYVTEYDIKSTSGFMNSWLGYGNRIGQETLLGEYIEYQENDVYRTTNYLEINRDLIDDLKVIRREVAPIDCGNTHNNFIRALHQNRRIKTLYSTQINLLVNEASPTRLLDVVDVDLMSPHSYENNETYNGKYLVTGKTISVSGAYYREKYELEGQGSNNDVVGFRT